MKKKKEQTCVLSADDAVVKEREQKMHNRKFWTIMSIIIALIVIASFLAGYFTFKLAQGDKINSIAWLVGEIDKHYLVYDEETGKVKEFTAEDYADAIKAGLLDTYSQYYTAEEYSEVVSTRQGNNYGLGLSFVSTKGVPKVHSVKGNSPAYKKGIKSGDLIVAGEVDGVKTAFISYAKMTEFLGERVENETFVLYITREGEFEDKVFEVEKKVFVTSFVTYFDSEKTGEFSSESKEKPAFRFIDGGVNKLDSQTAIIKFDLFEGDASNQLGLALDKMKERGRTKLILDMRNNGGGYMDVLEGVSALLTYGEKDKTLIARAVYKDQSYSDFYSTGNNFNSQITSISVIANEHTASASECLIGAMLHYKRAFDQTKLVVVNDGLSSGGVAKTYGKGIMQTTYVNGVKGDAVKLTTAYIYQPDTTTCIHGEGIKALAENSFSDNDLALDRAITVL